jgi:hypothetical protein
MIPQPTLDDRAYDDLLEEALALIPSLAPQWTNHNPSDPGITLVELFAWLTEMLVYRVNRLPEASTRAFLRLLNGPLWTPGPDLDADVRSTVLDLRRRHRAVTAKDYEELAQAVPGVKWAHCVPRRNLAEPTEVRRVIPREGYISLIVVPDPEQTGLVDPASWPGAPLPGDDLRTAVDTHLESRRLLTVRQAIVSPVYVPIQAEIIIATRPDVPVGPLRTRVQRALQEYLNALTGGPERAGWPFGRDVYVSELYHLLEMEVPGVDYVPDITLSSTCPEGTPCCVAGEELWNEKGDQIGIALKAHHLPWVPNGTPDDPEDPLSIDVVIGSVFLPVRIEIQATAAAGIKAAKARHMAKTAVKRLFHPLYGGPGGANSWEITTAEIATSLTGIVDASVAMIAPGRVFQDGSVTGVRFEAGEMADVTVTVNI